MKSHQLTIKDIAKILGISVSTVSRALKDHPDISQSTKTQVKEMANKLNYRPNILASNLRMNKTNTIGVIVPEIIHHFFATVISGIEDIAYDRGYNVMMCQSNESYEREVINAQALLMNRVDGVLVSLSKSTLEFDHFRSFIHQDIPIVFFDRICPEIQTDRVITDDEGGAFAATEHLISLGCKKIAHFSAPQNLLIGRGRYTGYQRALKHYRMPFEPGLILHCDTREDALEKTADFLHSNPKIDGIFAVNDSTAIAAVQAIQSIGKNVPNDIAVIGFGDGPIALIASPPLSTMDQKGYEIGVEAVKLLLTRIENEISNSSFQTIVINPTLMIRDSTNKKVFSPQTIES